MEGSLIEYPSHTPLEGVGPSPLASIRDAGSILFLLENLRKLQMGYHGKQKPDLLPCIQSSYLRPNVQ